MSDHPAGVCEPWGAYTDFTITLESKQGSSRWVQTSISTPQIVGEEPSTKTGAFSLIVDPNVDYT